MDGTAWKSCALSAFLALVVDCRCDNGRLSRDPAVERATFGDLAGASSIDLSPFLALARGVVEHKDAAALPETPSVPGRRAFVTAYRPHGARVVGSASSDTLRGAVIAAAQAAAADLPTAPNRVELDVIVSAEPILLDGELPPAITLLGLEGYAVTDGAARFGFVLAHEILYDKLFDPGHKMRITRDKLVAQIASRAGITAEAAAQLRGYRFRTQSVVESDPPGHALTVVRATPRCRPHCNSGDASPENAAAVTPDSLVESVRLGADYLARVLDANGKYIYLYHPLTDHPDSSYGMLRHSGTTYALLEAYEELRTPLYLEKASLALGYLTTRLRWGADPSGRTAYVVDNEDEEQQKVGGAGLALIAFAKRAQLTQATDQLETMRSIARLIVHQQYPDGHFRSNQDIEREDSKAGPMKPEVFYYPGEAILGLLRLYAVDSDPRWLEAATKGADYCVFTRDAAKSEEAQEHDQWLSYSLNELFRITKKDAYAKHAFKIARAIDRKLHRVNPTAPDLVGSFYDDAQSTLTATRLEAYDADILLSRAQGASDAPLVERGRDMAHFLQAQQLDKDSVYFLPNPSKSLGGVRESLFVYDVRIDYVQHAMSAWLNFARILRDPRYGGP